MVVNGGKTRRKRKVKHRFFVKASRFSYPEGKEPIVDVDPDTAHHMRTVLRLGTGAGVVIFDNSGKEYEGEIIESKPSRTLVRIDRALTPPVESPLKVTLAQALVKGNALDRIFTLCTELGCVRFTPLFTHRTVSKLNKSQAADRVKRWERITWEAAAQSGRVRVPVVDMPLDFKEFLSKKPDGARIILWERGGAGQLKDIIKEEGGIERVTILAGPEGGFEQAEVKQAMDAGFHIWGLGPRTLRAETAGATAISLLQFALGDMG